MVRTVAELCGARELATNRSNIGAPIAPRWANTLMFPGCVPGSTKTAIVAATPASPLFDSHIEGFEHLLRPLAGEWC